MFAGELTDNDPVEIPDSNPTPTTRAMIRTAVMHYSSDEFDESREARRVAAPAILCRHEVVFALSRQIKERVCRLTQL